MGRQPDHPQRLDPATDRRRPLRHAARPRRVRDQGRRTARRCGGRRDLGLDREVRRRDRRVDDRGRHRVQQRRHHAGRRHPRRGRSPTYRVGHRLPVHRPRPGTARRLLAVEPALDRDGRRVPDDDRGSPGHRRERRRHRDEGRDGRRVALRIRRAHPGEPRRRGDRRRPRDGLHRPVRVQHRAELPA